MYEGTDKFDQSNVILDTCQSTQGWQVVTTDGVKGELSVVQDEGRPVFKFDYDFCGKAGFALIRKEAAFRLPEHFTLSFGVKGVSPANTLEVKLIDPSGENVWWLPRPAYSFPAQWQRLVNKSRQFTYAWGPEKARFHQVGSIDLVISATTGGRGTVYFDTITLRELPQSTISPGQSAAVSVTSSPEQALHLLDANPDMFWRSDAAEAQEVVLDYGVEVEFGGLTIDWHGLDYAVDFAVDGKGADDQDWKQLYRESDNQVRRSFVYLPESQARFVRLRLNRSSRGTGYGIKKVALQPLSFAAQPADFFKQVAEDHPAGSFPRYLKDEQSYWTVVGALGESKKALINEEGMIEVEKLGFSLEPFIAPRGGSLLTWAQGEHQHSLTEGWMPIPQVVRKHENLTLLTTAWAVGEPGKSVLYAQYRLRNSGTTRQSGKLFLCARPFQVNPPWQFLNAPGGFSPIRSLEVSKNRLRINDKKEVISLAPATAGATTLAAGDIVEFARNSKLPRRRRVRDQNGFASGAFAYRFNLLPGQEMSVTLAVPFHGTPALIEEAEAAKQAAISFWQDKFSRLQLQLPDQDKELEETIKAQLAYILTNRNGLRIQPGTRCYDRSWARDGALTSSALLQFGFSEEVKEFIQWFAGHQFVGGKVPCAIDDRGADPTPEHDSPGELIYMVAEYYRYTRDKAFLKAMFPHVSAAMNYIQYLCAQTSTREYWCDDKSHLRGLMPPSISHEGYSDKPAYSYWDDFWTWRGLDDACFLSIEQFGEQAGVTKRYLRLRQEFKRDLLASVHASMKKHGINHIPGAADRGDFDSTSTTIAVEPGLLLDELEPQLRATFEEYWDYFLKRQYGMVEWSNYTPYELRVVGTLLRLGHRERAHQALDWFMKHRRPAGWKHWGEVVHNPVSTPKFIGDMPHGWVGSDFLRSARSLLVYERQDGALVVGAGFKRDWLFYPGQTRLSSPTRHGTIHLEMRRSGYRCLVKLWGDVQAPVVLQLPVDSKTVRVNGRPLPQEYHLGKLPAEIVIDLD